MQSLFLRFYDQYKENYEMLNENISRIQIIIFNCRNKRVTMRRICKKKTQT